MSPGEVLWRINSLLSDSFDRLRFPLGFYPGPAVGKRDTVGGDPWCNGFSVSDLRSGEWKAPELEEPESGWYRRLLDRADRIAEGKLSFFGLENLSLGDPIAWNREHVCGKNTPMGFSGSIDYRDYRVTGDCKIVWEPNRHHQLVVLARAFRASGRQGYGEAVVSQLDSWISQCPFGKGMNWRSPLEQAIRMINWVWAIDLIRGDILLDESFRERLLHTVYLHLWEITRKYSKGSSANNHSIGEAAGVFIATCYFPQMKDAEGWRDESRKILEREIRAQTYPDGGGREQAFGYHLFILQFFLYSGIAARRSGNDFSKGYWETLERMMAFVSGLSEGGPPPYYGDSDDGYVLDLGDGVPSATDLLAIGALMFDRSDFKVVAGNFPETARWLLGETARTSYEGLNAYPAVPVHSRAFPDSGLYLLQGGTLSATDDRISVIFDCGELGFRSIAAHGHADALSFTLRAFGREVFVDPGTYDYFTFPEWRNYFRGTSAHNTISVDDADQSVMAGPFMWGARASARCTEWETTAGGGTVRGEQDGYRRMSVPLMHRRSLTLDSGKKTLDILDSVMTDGTHGLNIHFHVSDNCSVEKKGPSHIVIDTGAGTISLKLDSRYTASLAVGHENPIAGWVSRGYHRKSPGTTIVGKCAISGNTELRCKIEIGPYDITESKDT